MKAEHVIELADLEAWDEFWADNGEALEDEVADEAACRALAMNCCLMVGGGAAPLFRVIFAG